MRLNKYITEKASLFDKDPDYMVVDTKTPNVYICSKWTHGKAPRDVYTVTNQGSKWVCNCPVRGNSCKHITLTKEWLKQGKPSPLGASFEDELKLFLKKYNV